MPEVMYSCVQYSDSCVQRSIRIEKSWKIDHFLILIKSVTPNPLVHQMATHLSYPQTNLCHVTLAEFVKHSRPVLVVNVKRTPESMKPSYLCLIM